MYFGIRLYRKNRSKIDGLIPLGLFLFFTIGYLYLMYRNGESYHREYSKFTVITMRYGIAFPAGVISFFALLKDASTIKLGYRKISKLYIVLGIVLLVYGSIEDLIVPPLDFFPASIINRNSFRKVFGFSSLYFKSIVGHL